MPNKSRHTLYAECMLKQNLAVEKIVNCHRFLFPDSPPKEELQQLVEQDISPYLISVDLDQSPMQRQIRALEKQHPLDAETLKTIEEKKGYIQQYTHYYESSVQIYQEVQPQLKALEVNEEEFSAPDNKRNEYLYIIDTETAGFLCKKADKEKNCPITFANKSIELKDKQTDAVRVWRNNVNIDKLVIRDNRSDIETAHRDGIQLIPPPKYREETDAAGKTVQIKEADQMAGMVLENTTITNCDILAPKAALQGIFSSDGMCRNLKVDQVKVGTQGGHAISISGVLTGCEFSNIKLYQQTDFSDEHPAPIPEIALFPVRIGGNMADDGMLYILDFKKGSGHEYGSFIDSNNKLYRAGSNQAEITNVKDYRKIIPERFKTMSCGLTDFNYSKYINEYSTWTLADFKRELPDAYQQMKAWIDRRLSEYSKGGEREIEIILVNGEEVPIQLPKISPEQTSHKKFGVLDMLTTAQRKLNEQDPAWLNTRLPDLQETAIRSFTMKCIAIRNGTVAPLYDLGKYGNALRKAYLRFILNDKQFNKPMVNAPYPTKPNDSVQAATNQTKPVAPKASEIWSRPEDNELKAALRVAPSLSVPQGEDIQLSLTSPFNDAGYSYKWTAAATDLPVGKNNTYTIKTTNLAVKDKYRIFCDVTKDGHMQRVIAYYNVKEKAAQVAETTKPEAVIPEGTWSSTPSLKDDLRITPSQTPAKGKKIKFFFREGSKYNDGSYTFRWSISGHVNLGTGKGKSRTVDTTKLDEGEYRQVFTVTDKNGKAHNGSVNFTIMKQGVSPATTGTGSHTEIPTISTADFETHKPNIIKDKATISVGDKVTFSLDANYEDARYYWIFDGNGITPQKGSKSTLLVDTTGFSPGKYRLRGTVTSKDRKQHQLSMWADVEEGNWIGIEIVLDDGEDISQYTGDKYELELPDGSKIKGTVKDERAFRINVPNDVKQAEFRWVD